MCIRDRSSSIPKGALKIADSQVATRWGNITDFKKFDLITPNEREARFSLADQDSSISDLTRRLKDETKLKNLILKLGERGIFASGKNFTNGFVLPSFTKNVVDTVGTGDALLAYSTLALVATKSLRNFDVTLGIGCGILGLDGNITNPLSIISETYKTRTTKGSSIGGDISYNKWLKN